MSVIKLKGGMTNTDASKKWDRVLKEDEEQLQYLQRSVSDLSSITHKHRRASRNSVPHASHDFPWKQHVSSILSSHSFLHRSVEVEHERRDQCIVQVKIVPFPDTASPRATFHQSTSPSKDHVQEQDPVLINITDETTFNDLSELCKTRWASGDDSYLAFCGQSGAIWHHQACVKTAIAADRSDVEWEEFSKDGADSSEGVAVLYAVRCRALTETALEHSFAPKDELSIAHKATQSAQMRENDKSAEIRRRIGNVLNNRGTTRCKSLLWKIDAICSALMLLMILVIAFAIDHDYPSAQESFVARFMEAAFACGNDTLTFADVKSLDDLSCFLSGVESPILQFLFAGTGICTSSNGITAECTAEDGTAFTPIFSDACADTWLDFELFGIASFCDYFEPALLEVSGPVEGRRLTTLTSPNYLSDSFSQILGQVVFFTSRVANSSTTSSLSSCAPAPSEIANYIQAVAADAQQQPVEQCPPVGPYRLTDCVSSLPTTFSPERFTLVDNTGTDVESRVSPSTIHGTYVNSVTPTLTDVQQQLLAMADTSFVDQFTRTLGMRFLIFNTNTASFAAVTVGFELSFHDGTLIPFYEWRESSIAPLLPVAVFLLFLCFLAGFGLIIDLLFFRAYSIQLWLTSLALNGHGQSKPQSGFGERSTDISLNKPRNSPTRTRRICRHLVCQPHFLALDVTILCLSVAGIVTAVHNMFEDRTVLDNTPYIVAELSAAQSIMFLCMFLSLLRPLKSASNYFRHARVMGAVLSRTAQVLIATVVIFLPVAFGITVLMNQSATSPMHGFGILQAFSWLPALFTRQNVPSNDIFGGNEVSKFFLAMFKIVFFPLSTLPLLAWASSTFHKAYLETWK